MREERKLVKRRAKQKQTKQKTLLVESNTVARCLELFYSRVSSLMAKSFFSFCAFDPCTHSSQSIDIIPLNIFLSILNQLSIRAYFSVIIERDIYILHVYR